ncbi:ATP-binding protein [Marinobacteraceae bacterium S3BR75-40.1]
MTLKRQLLILGLLTLLIPIAGVVFVTELEDALRSQEQQRLAQRTVQFTRQLAGSQALATLSPVPTDGRILYARALPRRPILDGYGDDWTTHSDPDALPKLRNGGDGIGWLAGIYGDQLYLYLRAHQPQPVYYHPDAPRQAHDQLRLYRRDQRGELQRWTVRTPAPGSVTARGPDGPDHRVQGTWQALGDGYAIELRMPLPHLGDGFGFTLYRTTPEGPAQASDQWGLQDDRLPVFRRPLNVAPVLAPFLEPGTALTLIDREGWIMGREQQPSPPRNAFDFDQAGVDDIGQQILLQGLRTLLESRQPDSQPLTDTGHRLAGPIISRAIGSGQPQQAYTRTADEDAPALTVTAPLPGRPDLWLVARQSTDAIISLSSNTLGRVLSVSVLLVGLLLLALVGYASWLSWRLRQLGQRVNAAVDAEGRVQGEYHPLHSHDELGALSRQIGRMVANLRGYTGYLESFASKLTHELKTPLAVVRSSLDNLRHNAPNDLQRPYLERAEQGAERLSRILHAMSEASRLERSIEHTETEHFDLAQAVSMAAEAYRGLDGRIGHEGPESGLPVDGAPELLMQALDKLVDNARDFTPADGRITIRLEGNAREVRLSVENDGPPLPRELGSEIFESFVSLRERTGDDSHLGQGLVIARLITQFHGGTLTGRNRSNGQGVIFTLSLPL